MKTLLLFGATGDLARRMLLPSLFGLDGDGLLPSDLRIVGAARSEGDDGWWREKVEAALREFLDADRLKPDLLARLHYFSVDVTHSEPFGELAKAVGDTHPKDLSIFLSTAPSLFEPTIVG